MKKITFTIALFLFLGNFIQAQVTVASIFSDNMVLQRNTKIPVWGLAKPNEAVTIKFHNQTKKTITDKNGKWSVYLDNEKAGGPFILSINGKTKIKNILVGEVWLCSGQSNMEFTVEQSDNAKNEISNANFPSIRHIKIPKEINSLEKTDVKKSNWEVCSPETVANFTAVGYFFAKELNQKNNVPIGLINASWGGTNIETWISREGFENSPEFNEMIAKMPKVDLNALLDLKLAAEKKRIEKLQKHPLTSNDVAHYSELNFKDTNWLEMQQPGFWEEQSLGDLDGIVWLRKHFLLSKEDLKVPISVQIPAIDDEDVTYVNGVKIGETSGWDLKRVYAIPSHILKEGDNVIAIKVIDNGAGGGIYGEADSLKLIKGNAEISLAGTWKFQVETIKNSINENEFPSLCYNAMINPLIPFAFKGVLWYQGESNEARAFQYNKAFPLLIKDWRSKFKSDFPFYFVQLASYETKGNSNQGCNWAELREAQTNTLKVEKTAMAVTTDLVTDPKDIHPKNKKDVGKRLASIAFHNLYNQTMICSGPTFKSFQKSDGKLILTFENIGSGLSSKNSSNFVFGFEVAGDDHVFYPAKGVLVSELKNGKAVYGKVSLTCDKVADPIAIRFGWIGDASKCNLFNDEGFPAIPFRTDDWKLNTLEIKYNLNSF